MGGLSIWHLLIVLIVAMLLFGAGRVSELGKGLGQGIRDFKKGLRDDDEEPRPKRRAAAGDDDEEEIQIVRVPKQLPAKKKRVIQIEVDEDADEAEIERKIAAKKAAMAAEDEKTT